MPIQSWTNESLNIYLASKNWLYNSWLYENIFDKYISKKQCKWWDLITGGGEGLRLDNPKTDKINQILYYSVQNIHKYLLSQILS